ncbi:IclR family transcriptional regulator [Mesorhizobium sp. CAU 1732]|uniref:IclR family transcriptional regulator n=1 Tax=Mesorhizobium sp. CAU 1732 TaxID=3140358 RepID=UPI0032602C83
MVSQINGSVVKAFEILSLFNDGRDEISAATLAERLGMNAVTAHRFLRTLEFTGALVAVSKGTYRLGFTLADLGLRAADPASLSSVVQPILERLTTRLGEGSMATVFDGEYAVCIAKAVPDRPLFIDIRKGSRLEAYATAHGKLWLAHLPSAELDQYFEATERRLMTNATAVSRTELEPQLIAARETGLSFNRGERESHIHGIAVPVLGPGGRMICGLSVFGTSTRITEDGTNSFAGPLREAAKEVSRLLYGTSDSELTNGSGKQAAKPRKGRSAGNTA